MMWYNFVLLGFYLLGIFYLCLAAERADRRGKILSKNGKAGEAIRAYCFGVFVNVVAVVWAVLGAAILYNTTSSI